MMKKTIVIYNQFDIVTVPFPFIDSPLSKKRPAIVLSSAKAFNGETGHSIMAMITSARNSSWPYDVLITDLSSSGLSKSSIIRMKFFTINHSLIIKTIGSLSKRDQSSLCKAMKSVFGRLV